MKHHTHSTRLFCASLLAALCALQVALDSHLVAAPLGTAFTYQGRLNDGTNPAQGDYDLRFAIYDAASSGTQVGAALTNAATPVANGLFTVTLDFGAGVFSGNARWLEIAVRPASGGAFTSLTPRQPLAPAPHALYAPTAGTAATATSAQAVSVNAVTSAGIASGQVVKSLNGLKDAVRLAAGPNVTLATNANTLTISAAGGGADGGWSTTGNAGTTPTDNFLGTTDGQPLVLQANNVGVNTNDPQATLHVNGTVRATRFEGDGGGLTGINASLSTPFTLTNLANVHLGGVARGVAIKDHYAILANGYDGVRIFDIADPAHPVAVAHVSDLQADAWTVATAGWCAFVGTSSGLVGLDVSVPHSPTEISRLDTEAGVSGVAFHGGGLILANDTDGLRTCYLLGSSPPWITVITASVTNNGGRAWGVAVADDLAFLANEADGLRIYSVSNLAKPVMLGHAKTPDRAFGVAAAPGNLVYVASGYDGLLIYDVSNPSVPALVHTIPGAGAEARRVTISGPWALVAWNDEGIRAYDISDPRNPVEVGHAPLAGDGFALDVTLAGTHAFAANEIGGLGTYLAAPLATVPGIVSAAGFAGDGSKLTQLNASELTGELPASVASGFWQVSGNSGANLPAGAFLGTTDTRPLEFKVNGQRALRLEAGMESPNVIGGHAANIASDGIPGATISGGGSAVRPNRVGARYATVVGGEGNTASARHSTAMGYNTWANGDWSTAMGHSSRAIGSFSTAMGERTTASGYASTAMGGDTTADGAYSTAMGDSSSASGSRSTAMGSYATASGWGSTAMGKTTRASGDGATAMGDSATASGEVSIAMGSFSTASESYTLAAGRRAKAIHKGTFVWADSRDADFSSAADDQFLIRAGGGVVMQADDTDVDAEANQLLIRGQTSNAQQLEIGYKTSGNYATIQAVEQSVAFRPLILQPAGGRVGIGKTTPVTALDVNGTVTATAFNPSSDRNLKEKFAPVNPLAVLDKVAALPISRWNFKGDAATPHVGPMAQDFHAAFGVGTDDKHIATVDADGVALAAIQGLNQKVESGNQKAETRMERLEAENAELKRELAELKRLVGQLIK